MLKLLSFNHALTLDKQSDQAIKPNNKVFFQAVINY